MTQLYYLETNISLKTFPLVYRFRFVLGKYLVVFYYIVAIHWLIMLLDGSTVQ